MGCLAEMETGGGKERSEGRNFEKIDTGWAAGKEIRWGTCAWQRWRRQEGRGKKWREGTLKRGVRERGTVGKEIRWGSWQRWKQEGRRECLAKMETGGGKERVEGRDCNERDTGGTVGKGIRWGWDEEAGGRLRDGKKEEDSAAVRKTQCPLHFGVCSRRWRSVSE